MASSIDSNSTNHVKGSAMSEDPHDLIRKMTEIMEGKSEGERQALLETLKNSLTLLPQVNNTNSVNKVNDDKCFTDQANHSNNGESLKPLDNQNLVKVESTKILKEKNSAVKDKDSYKDINNPVNEENLVFEYKNHCEKEGRKEETAHSHEVSSKIPIVQKKNTGPSQDKVMNIPRRKSLEDDDIHHTPSKDTCNVENISTNSTLTVRYNNTLDADKKKLKSSVRQKGELVASSDDDMPPSTPASGGQSSGSDLSESPSESLTVNPSTPIDSTTHVDKSTASFPTHQHIGFPYSEVKAVQSLNQDMVNNTPKKTVQSSCLPITTQPSPLVKSITDSSAIQKTGLNKTPVTCDLPARNQECASLDTGQYHSPCGVYTSNSQVMPENQDYSSFGLGQFHLPTKISTGLHYPGLLDASKSMLISKKSEPASEPFRTQGGLAFGRHQSLQEGVLSTSFKNVRLNDAYPSSPPAGSLPINTSGQFPVTTTVSSLSTSISSQVNIPQNSFSTINRMSGMPLYYQPHIVMQDQLPVFVLHPLLAQDFSSSSQVSLNSKGLNLESFPLSFSLQSKNDIKGDTDNSDRKLTIPFSVRGRESIYHPKTEEAFAFGAELGSGYASSVTDSEIDEAAPFRKLPYVDRKQTTCSQPSSVMNQSSYGQTTNNSYNWEFPPSNPFVGSYDVNDVITSTSDLETFSSTVPTVLSQQARSLYNKQVPRSKNTNQTNPFAPELPPRADIPELTRNKLNSIPKSMLARTDWQSASVSQKESDGVTRTHQRRLSSESMITLIESECEEGSSPLDISDIVANHIITSENSYQPWMFESSSAAFFKENSSLVSHNNRSVAAHPTSQVNAAASVTTSQPETLATKELKKAKPKLPGHVAPLWIPDEQISKCCCCHQSFTMFRRKHHCRGCGKIFCSSCCSQLARLSYLQYRTGRICLSCTHLIKDAIRARKAQRLQGRQEKTKPVLKNEPPPNSRGNQMTASPPSPYLAHSLPNSNSATNSTYTVPSHPGNTFPNQGTNTYVSQVSPPQALYTPNATSYQPNSITYPDSMTGKVISAPVAYQSLPLPGQTKLVPQQTAAQLGTTVFQNHLQGNFINACGPLSQQYARSENIIGPSLIPEKPEPTEVETQPRNLTLPLRPAGRIVSWRGWSFSSQLMLNERRKALAKDLKELPNGVTIQVADELQVIVKKVRVLRQPAAPYQVWCFSSNGLEHLKQTEIVILIEIEQKESLFPEEVLRIYKVILDLVKLGNIFMHGNFLAFNSPFLGSTDNAAFLFASDSYTKKLQSIYEDKTKILYGILVKRPELEIVKYVPMRFLLRLGQETKSFPFPIVNSRERAVVYDGIDAEDKFYLTSFAMNKYLENSVPEALIPGLVVFQENSKVVLQIPVASQAAVLSLFDRLNIKVQQTATIPFSSDISLNVHDYKVFHQSIVTQEVSLAKSTSLFSNPNARRQSRNPSVIGLGFIILHIGTKDNGGGEFIDDGAILYLSKFYTQKLRSSLYEHSNCYFYLGDQFKIVHFELRWLQDQKQTQVIQTSAPSAPQNPPNNEEFPGTATIDVKHSGYTAELKKLAAAGFEYVSVLIRSFEDRIRRVCMEPLIMQANRMKAGEAKELILRVSLKEGVKKWSIGPSNQPMNLIRSLQMALHAVTLTELHNACLELTFDVTIIKQ